MPLKSKEEKKMLKRIASFIIAFALVLSLFAGIGVYAESPQADLTAKNVILLIGSGISPAHVTAAKIKSGKQLNLLNMTYSGSLVTVNSDNAISDPAAAATALSTGKKTLNYNLGIDNEGNEIQLITEALQSAGKKVGIITDKYLNDATPAAFAVHNPLKSDLYGIARQEIASGIDLFLGGGSKYFDNYRADITAAGYDYVTSPGRLSTLTPGNKILGAFSNYSFDTGYQVPSLSAMLSKATELLDNDNGFFIVAEGGMIDKYCFERNMTKMVDELVKFDEAVGTAMAYVDEHPDTLLVVVGDVEAGELKLADRPNQGNTTNSCFKRYGTSSLNSALYTYGRNASAFTGEHSSVEVPKFIAASIGIRDFALDTEPMSFAADYIVDELNSFSSWSFTNIRKNSSVNGIKLTTTSSNNTAVTAMVSKGSLVVMANPKVGFNLTVTTPLATPFKLKSSGSADLSAYDGFVISASGFGETEFTIGVAKGSDFAASVTVTEDMKNEYNEILLPFSSFEPAITARNAVGLDTFSLSTAGCSVKSTLKIDSIHAYKVDAGLNYYDVLGLAYGKDPYEYTASSFANFAASFETYKAAVARADRYAAKLDLLAKLDALVAIPLSAEPFAVIAENADSFGVSSASVALHNGALDVFCGSADASITFDKLPEATGSYGAIRFRIGTLYPDFTAGEFAVKLTFATAGGEVEETIERAVISNGSFCFALPDSDITGMKIEFINASIGAVLRINGVELLSNAPAKSVKTAAPSALSILRAAAGLGAVENGDLNGDGKVDVADALIALRAECGLA